MKIKENHLISDAANTFCHLIVETDDGKFYLYTSSDETNTKAEIIQLKENIKQLAEFKVKEIKHLNPKAEVTFNLPKSLMNLIGKKELTDELSNGTMHYVSVPRSVLAPYFCDITQYID